MNWGHIILSVGIATMALSLVALRYWLASSTPKADVSAPSVQRLRMRALDAMGQDPDIQARVQQEDEQVPEDLLKVIPRDPRA